MLVYGESSLAAALERHRSATQSAGYVRDDGSEGNFHLTARAAQNDRVARDRRHYHEAHATDLGVAAQETFIGTRLLVGTPVHQARVGRVGPAVVVREEVLPAIGVDRLLGC